MVNQETLNRLRQEFPSGCRVKLLVMNDPYAPPIGTLGTVADIDDIGSLLVHWDNGSGLHVLYGIDRVEKIDNSSNE